MTTKKKATPVVEPTADVNAATIPVATEAPKEATVKIAAAKGRPMLSWVGKRPLGLITAFPAQPIERVDPQHVLGTQASDAYARGGLLFHGDNKEVLAHLLASGFRGKVNLIYIDPPFDSGADYVRKVSLRGGGAKLEGEAYTLGEQKQYSDIWANDNYLQFMYERLLLLKELMAENASIFLHCDNNKMHYLRCLMDEVFGQEGFVNEIVWQHQIMGGSINKLPKAHETIFWYVKGDNTLRRTDPNVRVPFSKYVQDTMRQDENGLWFYERRRMSRKATIQEAASKAHTRTYVPDPDAGTVVTDVWTDMPSYQETPDEREGLQLYPTQKTTKLITRIVSAASDPGDLVLDCFNGSGVVAKVAQKLGRRWIGCDINKGAIQTTSKRLQSILSEQIAPQSKPTAKNGTVKVTQTKLDVDDTAGADETAAEVPAIAQPAQLAFSVWRVNDYDLQIQHNEAVELACQHLGVSRTRGDSFFEGTRGQSLVKIVPFNHPLSPLDLEEVKTALSSRPDETRPVLMVCLGVELAAKAWLEDYNRLRKVSDPNRIDYIELRTDPKYGKFFVHRPATAQVTVTRHGKTGRVKIENFASPTILERLAQTAGVLSPHVDDWRAMVDCILIDTSYDGQVFNVVLSDVPEKKNDLVSGEYELPLPQSPTLVGVKIIDMLGEEVLETVKV